MVRRRRHPEVRIRTSSPYPRSGGAPSASGRRVESCVRRIFSDLFGFGIHWCGFMSVSFDLRLSSLAMVAALVRWSFGALTRWLPVCLLQQALLRQALSGSDDGEARTTARLRLVLVFVVVTRWSNYLFVFFITLGLFIVLLMIINRSVEFQKKNYFCPSPLLHVVTSPGVSQVLEHSPMVPFSFSSGWRS
jgi:hypothetical protein